MGVLALCCNLPSYLIQILTEATVPGEYLSQSIGDTVGPPYPSFDALTVRWLAQP